MRAFTLEAASPNPKPGAMVAPYASMRPVAERSIRKYMPPGLLRWRTSATGST